MVSGRRPGMTAALTFKKRKAATPVDLTPITPLFNPTRGRVRKTKRTGGVLMPSVAGPRRSRRLQQRGRGFMKTIGSIAQTLLPVLGMFL